MSRICLYADEDAAETAIVNALASAGYDVLTAQKAGTEGDGDLQQLEFASSQRRTVYTLNTSDFAILHAKFMTTGRHHAGIITIPGATLRHRREAAPSARVLGEHGCGRYGRPHCVPLTLFAPRSHCSSLL
jgi:hypothetical protein